MSGLSISPGLALGRGLSFAIGLSTAGGLSPTLGLIVFQGLGSLSVAFRQTMQEHATFTGSGGLQYPGSVAFQTNPATLPGAGALQGTSALALRAIAGFSGTGGA